MRTTTIKLDGNTFAAKSLADMEVNRLLENFRKATSFQNLQQNKQRVNLVGGPFDGAHVTLTTQFGIETVEVFIPPRVVVPPPPSVVGLPKPQETPVWENPLPPQPGEFPALYGYLKSDGVAVQNGWIVFVSGRIDLGPWIFLPTTDHPEQFIPDGPVYNEGKQAIAALDGDVYLCYYLKTPPPVAVDQHYPPPHQFSYPNVTDAGESYYGYWEESAYAIPTGCWVRGMSQWASDSVNVYEEDELTALYPISRRERRTFSAGDSIYYIGFEYDEAGGFTQAPKDLIPTTSFSSVSVEAVHIGVGMNPSGGCAISGVNIGVVHPDDPIYGCYDGRGCAGGAEDMLSALTAPSMKHTLEEIGYSHTWNESDLQWGWDGSYHRETDGASNYNFSNILFVGDEGLYGGFGGEYRRLTAPNTFSYSSWLAPYELDSDTTISKYETYEVSGTYGESVYDLGLVLYLAGKGILIDSQTLPKAEAFSSQRRYSYTYYVTSHATHKTSLMCAGHYPPTKYSGDAFQILDVDSMELVKRSYSRDEPFASTGTGDIYILDYGGAAFPTVIRLIPLPETGAGKQG